MRFKLNAVLTCNVQCQSKRVTKYENVIEANKFKMIFYINIYKTIVCQIHVRFIDNYVAVTIDLL